MRHMRLSESQVINTVKGESYTKAEGDTRYQPKGSYQASGDYATNSTVNSKFDAANSNANNRVPNTRKVNNKPLSADITITASDVGAYTKAESDTKIADAKKMGTDAQVTANAANTNATNANNNANGRVPNTRKVNNKALSADITLTASDIGAYTKAETDARYPLTTKQTWQNVTANRSLGVTYTNTTGSPITVNFAIAYGGGTERSASISVNGTVIQSNRWSGDYTASNLSLVIPIGATYKLETNRASYTVMELR
uniref:Uncharacterized protein n=2 Tax=Providencia TaxID=586 RepID=A0AAI9HYL3_PROST|nr:hypothetical protein [Providencia stuartii]